MPDSASTATVTTAAGAAPSDSLEVHNPATGELVGSVPLATRSDVAAAVARARAAQPAWAARSWRERAAVIARFHDLALDRGAQVLDSIQSESGKARRDAITELVTVASTARYYTVHGRRHLKAERARAAIPVLTNARVEHVPVGVVGLITPWNYPFLLGIGDALPALLAGNSLVIKPSEMTPLSAVLAAELLAEAGLPEDVLQLVHGAGGEVGDELVRHVDYVGFTGSTATGRLVARAAAERLVPCSLELGGKNPMLVLEGADIDNAVWEFVNGAFCNSGQTCISIERVYVQDAIYDRFVAAATKAAAAVKVGWSTGWDTDMGSLASVAQADRVEAHIEDATSKGATVLVGGKRRRDLGDAFVEPTILAGVEPGMLAEGEETFGPVVSIHRIATAEEGLALANASEYGLNGSIWAGSRRRARELASRMQVGSAGINSTLLVYATLDAPMGGIRQSGLGRRHGAAGILRYTHARTIVSSVAWNGGYESIPRMVTSDKRAAMLTGLFKVWRKLPGLR